MLTKLAVNIGNQIGLSIGDRFIDPPLHAGFGVVGGK
jgi:hypothetical protein